LQNTGGVQVPVWQNWRIDFPELLRGIQFYNTWGYHWEPGTEDNYGCGPPPGNDPTLELIGEAEMVVDAVEDGTWEDPGVTARDWQGNDISDTLEIEGDVDIQTPGLYELEYEVRDAFCRRVKKTRKVFVSRLRVWHGEREILASPQGDANGDGIPDDMAYINHIPNMPELRAQLVNSGSLPVRWRFEVHYSRDGVPNTNGIFDPYYYPQPIGETPQFIECNGEFPILWPASFCGGNAIVVCSVFSIEREFHFRVLGLNPPDTVVRTHIDTNAGVHVNYAYAIARHESVINGQYYCQFNPPGAAYEFEPNKDATAGADGFGIMMVDPPDNRHQLWNWRDNVYEGLDDLDEKRDSASDWIADQIDQQESECPECDLANEVFVYNGVAFQEGTARTPIDACTIQAYNGANPWTISWHNGVSPIIGYWEQVASAYVDAVCAEMD